MTIITTNSKKNNEYQSLFKCISVVTLFLVIAVFIEYMSFAATSTFIYAYAIVNIAMGVMIIAVNAYKTFNRKPIYIITTIINLLYLLNLSLFLN